MKKRLLKFAIGMFGKKALGKLLWKIALKPLAEELVKKTDTEFDDNSLKVLDKAIREW